ncbi:MAG: trypsin-like peptidase domain-containing protein [Desulfobacca sp.]|nr:trypsin-like peptidase domain-containing protein [Desulfobacca sp.]
MIGARNYVLFAILVILACCSILCGCESKTESVSQQIKKQPPSNIAELVRLVSPAVVNIQAFKGPITFEQTSPWFKFFGFPRGFEDFGSSPSTASHNQGSGFLIDPQGHVVTNHHLVRQAQKLVVTSWQGQKVTAQLIGDDPQTDLSLLKLDDPLTQVAYLAWGDSEQVQVGDRVLALGNPFGLENTVTLGIISAKGRVIGAGSYDNFLQTDAAINPGNSGGPLVTLQGAVVGISTAILARGQGIGFAIPSSMARPILDQLTTQGRVIRGFLGVIVQKVTPELAASFGLKNPAGALVGDVIPETAAARAGVRRGDIIMEFDGHPIPEMAELPRRTALTPVGKQVNLKVFRGGQMLNLNLRVGELPPAVE